MAAYAEALADSADAMAEIGADRTSPGTINALVVDYYRSDEWENQLAEDTRKTRRRIIERFRLKHGDWRVALVKPNHISKMLAAIGKPSAKRHWLKAIRGLLRFAVPTMLKVDPTKGIANIKLRKSKGHHTWTDDEIEQYRAYWPLGTQQRLVMEFALETASRRGEVVRLGPQHIKNGWIRMSARTAARMWRLRCRQNYKRPVMQCRRHISLTSSRRRASRARNTVSVVTSPNGLVRRDCRSTAACMASRRAACADAPKLEIRLTS
jgi:integrase